MNKTVMNVRTDAMCQSYTDTKKRARTIVRKIVMSKMLADSIRHLILPGFKLIVDQHLIVAPYNHKFPPKMNVWDEQVARIAKFLEKEPYKSIGAHEATANFYVRFSRFGVQKAKYPRYSDMFVETYIDVTTANTEKCEIYETEKVHTYKENVLTGYCKTLHERTYLETSN